LRGRRAARLAKQRGAKADDPPGPDAMDEWNRRTLLELIEDAEIREKLGLGPDIELTDEHYRQAAELPKTDKPPGKTRRPKLADLWREGPEEDAKAEQEQQPGEPQEREPAAPANLPDESGDKPPAQSVLDPPPDPFRDLT
jgi:hypothetical protein